jgi:hybrid cluster-associated redox disulfide protein
MQFGAEDIVDDIMRKHPAAVRVFLNYSMRCVGCPIGPFHTIADACREHAADCAAFLSDLEHATAPTPMIGVDQTRHSSGESART